MYCERCKKYAAVFHLTDFQDSKARELHLCGFCATDTGLDKKLEKNIMCKRTVFLAGIQFSENSGKSCLNETICANCGLTLKDVQINKKPGCPSCYKFFKQDLFATPDSAKKYAGKKPLNYVDVLAWNMESFSAEYFTLNTVMLKDLERNLYEAVLVEKFEEAAVLRDKIRELNSW